MTHRVEISPAAQRHLRRTAPQLRDRIERALYRLADDPYPRGSIKLRGEENTWRIRVGRLRIVYEVHPDMLLVVLRVALRGETTYRM